MSAASESSQLLPSSIQAQSIVRETVHHTISRTLYTSYTLVVFRLAVSIVKTLAATLVISLSEMSLLSPLGIFVLVSIILDASYFVLQILRIPTIKRIRGGEDAEEPETLSLLFKLQAFTFICWHIPGNIIYWTCED